MRGEEGHGSFLPLPPMRRAKARYFASDRTKFWVRTCVLGLSICNILIVVRTQSAYPDVGAHINVLNYLHNMPNFEYAL